MAKSIHITVWKEMQSLCVDNAIKRLSELYIDIDHVERIVNYELGIEGILDEKTDLLIIPLNEFPTEYSDQLVIAGLTNRTDASFCLVSREAMSENIRCRYKYLQNTISYLSLGGTSQIQSSYNKILESLKRDPTGSAILPTDYIESFDTEEKLTIRKLQVKEFVPYPGQGTAALICLKDKFEMRKNLIQFHQWGMEECTNIERGVKKEIGEDLGIHIYKDGLANYHAQYSRNKNGNLILGSISSSSSVGLLKSILEKIK